MAPSPADRPDLGGFNSGTGLDLASQILQAQGPDRFVMCRSGLRSYDDGNCLISSMFWFIILYYHCYRNLQALVKALNFTQDKCVIFFLHVSLLLDFGKVTNCKQVTIG